MGSDPGDAGHRGQTPLFGRRDPDARGYFGAYGGRFVPETLVAPIEELTAGYLAARADVTFSAELDRLLKHYVGRPTPVYEAARFAASTGGSGVRVFLKREDLAHTGAHKLNNALGQALLAKRMGKTRVVAETGAGQHGVASATACALLGLECHVYMGTEDMRRQAPNVLRMQLLGATVRQVDAGSKTLKDAIYEAMRDWVANVGDTLTGVRVEAFRRKSDCLRACKDTNKNDRKAENDLYASNISACGGDAACRAAENTRHAAALQAIDAAYLACQNSCHSQGGGTVGN